MDFEDGYRLRRYPGSHLSGPLTAYPQRLIIKYHEEKSTAPNTVLERGVKLLDAIDRRHHGMNFYEDPTAVYYKIFSSCYSQELGDVNNEMKKKLGDTVSVALRDTIGYISALKKQHPGFCRANFEEKTRVIDSIVEKMTSCYSVYLNMIDIRSKIQRSTADASPSINSKNKIGNMEVWFVGELIAVVTDFKEKNCSVLNYEQWVMLADTVSSRLLTMITCEFNDHYQLDILPSTELLRTLYKWGDELIAACHMDAYAVIGEYESIVTSIFVTFGDSDPLGLGKDYLESVFVSAREIFEEYKVPVQWTIDLHNIMNKIPSVNILSELFGLRKHWGNPMVDAAASGKAVQEILNEDIPIDPGAVMQLLAAFNRMITLAYIQKHKTWPKCYFQDQGESYPLKRAWESQTTRILEADPGHNHLHWANLKFKCNCVTSTYDNPLQFLSDKAVALPADQLDLNYVKALRSKMGPKSTDHDRRLLLEFLRTEQLSIQEIFKIIMCNEYPTEWLANAASMKGTELKHLKARIFAVLGYEIRQYFAVTEDMIKEYLFPYNPHQTMTMSESQLLGRLREVATQMDPANSSETLNVLHIIDFSKWNLRMRRENTSLVFRSIDAFLGYPGLIEKTHILFEEMINAVGDPFNPPVKTVMETFSSTIWSCHTRGWEGQRQKGWTLLTSALLSDLERLTGVKCIICGQGDNQVLLTYFKIPDKYNNAYEWIQAEPGEVRKVVDSYYNTLEDSCLAVGLKVKTAETCRSLRYMNYGKRLYYNGVELSMTLKRISKSMTESNDAFPITENRLKTSQGASYSAGLYSNPSPWPYLISRICTYMILYESYVSNPILGDAKNIFKDHNMELNARFFSILLKMPSSLGGPPQQPFSSFLCRGHPDPLCEDLVSLCLRAKNGCKVSIAIIKIAREGFWFSEDKRDLKALIMAPFSLRLNVPVSVQTPLSKAVVPALHRYCKNSMVKSMLSRDTTTYEEKLIKILSKMDPFNPLIANDVYSRTVAGQMRAFVDGLTNATSLCRLIMELGAGTILEQIKKYEREQLVYWMKAVIKILNVMRSKLIELIRHDVLAKELRTKSWGVDLEGVTVPHPLETFRMVESDNDDCNNHIETDIKEHLILIRHSDNLYGPEGSDGRRVQMTRSRSGRPYLGNRISEGIISRQLICKTPTTSWTDSCRLNVIRNWIAEPNSELDNLFKQIIESRTDASIALLDMSTGKPSRMSYSHRANLLATKKDCSITTTSNMATRIYLSSNQMGTFSAGDYNLHLPFGPTFISFSMMLCLGGILEVDSWARNDTRIYHCHVDNADIPIVFDGRIDIPPDLTCTLPSIQTPPILYSSVRNLLFENVSGKLSENPFDDYDKAQTFDCLVGYGMVLLGDSLMHEICKHELINVDITNYYERRESSITLGDIKLTNVLGLIRAISTTLLLSMPIEFHQYKNLQLFSCAVMAFENNLSDGFWNNLTSAFIKAEVVNKLKRHANRLFVSYTGKSTKSLKETLQFCVISDMWSIIRQMVDRQGELRVCPISIYAPNTKVSLYLYGRLLEVIIWQIGWVEKVGIVKRGFMGKEIMRFVNSFDQGSSKSDFVTAATTEFVDIFCRAGIDIGFRVIPKVKFFNLNDPWIDKVRSLVFQSRPETSLVISEKEMPDYSRVDDLSFYLGENELITEDTSCNCMRPDIGIVPDLSRLANRYFRFDRFSGYILGVLVRYGLNSNRVMIFGDLEGELGFTLDSHLEGTSVYVAGSKNVTEFDPHNLGNYVPTVFIGSSAINKLLHCQSANVIGDPTQDSITMMRAISHVAGLEMKGIVFRMHDKKDRIEQYKNINRSIKMLVSHLPSLEWCLMLLSLKCVHDLESALSIIGNSFKVIHVHQSPLSSPSQMDCIIIGLSPRLRVISEKDEFKLVRFLSTDSLNSLVESWENSIHPKICSLESANQKSWINFSSEIGGNLSELCNLYVQGWGYEFPDRVSPGVLVKSLSEVQAAIKQIGERLESTQSMIHKGGHIGRSDVLALGVKGAWHQLQHLLRNWMKCAILKALLETLPADLDVLVFKYYELIQRKYTVVLGSRKYEAKYQSGALNRDFSGIIFGILGYMMDPIRVTPNFKPIRTSHFLDESNIASVTLPVPDIFGSCRERTNTIGFVTEMGLKSADNEYTICSQTRGAADNCS